MAAAFPLRSATEAKTAVNAEFMRLKSTYEKEIQKIDDSDLEIIVSEQEKYTAALVAIKKQAQQAGKLEQLLVLDRELERFAAQKKIDADNVSRELPDLASVQNACINAVDGLPVTKAGKVVALVQNYEKALGNLQETLTRSNDIKSAVEVKNERDRLSSIPELITAKATLAEAEAKVAAGKAAVKMVEKDVPKVAAVVDAPAKAADKIDAPVKKKYTGTPEKRVRQRFDDLCKAILKQDVAKASEFVEPELARKIGPDGIRRCFRGIFPFLQLADDPHRKLTVDSAKLSDDKTFITVVPKLWAVNQWHDLPSNKWVESDGDWYIDVEGADEQRFGKREMRELTEPNGPRPGPNKPIRRMLQR